MQCIAMQCIALLALQNRSVGRPPQEERVMIAKEERKRNLALGIRVRTSADSDAVALNAHSTRL